MIDLDPLPLRPDQETDPVLGAPLRRIGPGDFVGIPQLPRIHAVPRPPAQADDPIPTSELMQHIRNGTVMPRRSLAEALAESQVQAQPTPVVCTVCQDKGYLVPDVSYDDPRFGKLIPCQCREQARMAARRAPITRQSDLEEAAYQRMTFAAFAPQFNPSLMEALAAARAYATQPEGVFILAGGYGTGKTHLAAAVGNVRHAAGDSVLFLAVPDLLDYLRSAFDPRRGADDSYAVRFERVRSVDLLILDDLGTESSTPWALEKLFQIINHRVGRGLPLVVTTNARPDTIDPRVRSRGYRRLYRDTIFVLIAPDYCEQRAARPWQDWRTLGGREDAGSDHGEPYDRGEGE